VTAFVEQGWHRGGTVRWIEPRLLAGNPENGTPAAQWLILPNIVSDLRVFGRAAVQTLGMPSVPSTSRVMI